MPVTYDEFCPHCHEFQVAGKAIKPSCASCFSVWASVADYWRDLDLWEADHKMKITDFRARNSDPKGYVANGLEKDLAVLVANTRLDMSNQMAKKILDVMEATGKGDPSGTLNRIAILLGGFVGDAIRDLDAAEKEAKNS